MTLLIKFTNQSGTKTMEMIAEKVMQRIKREPVVINRARKEDAKIRDLGKYSNTMIITGTIADYNGKTALQRKQELEEATKTWWRDGLIKFYWKTQMYTGTFLKCDIDEMAAEDDLSFLIEFQEGEKI